MPVVDKLLRLFICVAAGATGAPSKPNIVWFLTDDQDQVLGSSFPLTTRATPMPKTKALMQEQGKQAMNWYFHNIKKVGGFGYCSGMHVNYSKVSHENFASILQEKGGYTTGMFGKYVNAMLQVTSKGWDAWLANGGGTYISPIFETKNIDGFWNGIKRFSGNYTTAVVGNLSIAWIKKVAKEGKPFFAYIAPKAAHEPFNPAPWYRDHWESWWPSHEPQGENWNCSAEARKDHHGNIASMPLITEDASNIITGIFKNRWRTLMSVDDLISDVIKTVDDLGLLNSTYFFYSSDHGFQLGQFNIPMDKRHVYEWDTKIHLLARGPGIAKRSTFTQPGTQVDVAPTLLGLAGVSAPASMDGRSIVPLLIDDEEQLLTSTAQHMRALGDATNYKSSWRKEVFIEAYYCSYNVKCVAKNTKGHYPRRDAQCADLANNSLCWKTALRGPTTDPNCYETESPANNFIALRRPGTAGDNTLYAEFQTGDMKKADVKFDKIDFVEYYEMTEDKWQMRNLAQSAPEAELAQLHARLHAWASCSGASCDPTLDVNSESVFV